MHDYPLIANHGLVGDLQTAALIATDGTVDWWCAPRFDSPSIFASLLDSERGGYCRVSVVDGDSAAENVRQLYLPDTSVLLTRFMTEQGVGEVADFMVPDESTEPKEHHSLYRAVRVVRGSLSFDFACRPRFDYGRAAPSTAELHAPGTALLRGPEIDLSVRVAGPAALERDGADVTASFTLEAGQMVVFVLTSMPTGWAFPEPLTLDETREAYTAARAFWQQWLRSCTYRGRWQQMVKRSAITIKLLTYAPSAAPIAAATMGLPEQIGGERNWDYRFTWVRDASLAVRALTALGFAREAFAFRRWLRDRFVAGQSGSGEPLQIMYRIDGDPHLTEEVLDHLEGYRGSAPVRAGNAAADQIQLDIYGEAAYAFGELGDVGAAHGWRALAELLDWLCDHWDRPDEGIWETRGGRQDFTYSRLMTWVAFDRGIRLAVKHARPADLGRWTSARDAVFNQILERAWDPERKAFVQAYGGHTLDASLLLMPQVGFLEGTDPAWLSTLDAMGEELVSDSLVYRYNPDASPDGLRGSEGTFSMCSFQYVEALARADRLDDARYAFDKMLTYANHVGLFAEEIGASGEQLGNFPQAFTHLALIGAALVLDEKLDLAEGRG